MCILFGFSKPAHRRPISATATPSTRSSGNATTEPDSTSSIRSRTRESPIWSEEDFWKILRKPLPGFSSPGRDCRSRWSASISGTSCTSSTWPSSTASPRRWTFRGCRWTLRSGNFRYFFSVIVKSYQYYQFNYSNCFTFKFKNC